MLAKVRRPLSSLRPSFRFVLFVLPVTCVIVSLFVFTTMDTAQASSSLLDRARLGTWTLPVHADPPFLNPKGYQESDFIYANGKYYLFATGSQDPAWVDVYVGNTPEQLVHRPPTFTHVAPIRYPTAVKDGNTWHIWGVNPVHKWTEHWTSTNADPTGFAYADSPFPLSAKSDYPVVDFAVRKHPTNGYWYGVGFETTYNSPLLLTRASSPNGPWEKLNYKPRSTANGVFGDTGAPPWASAARPDPNLAFTQDGRAWIFFTGNAAVTSLRTTIVHRAGVVEVDIKTGKAIGNAVVLFDPRSHQEMPITVMSDLNLIAAPGQPERIFAETNSPDYPLAIMDLAPLVTPTDGRTSADLVRLDMARGFGVAAGITPGLVRTPYRWDPEGLIVDANYGGVASYLAGAYLSDLTFTVEFTPKTINPSAINTVAHIGGPYYTKGSSINVQIDATNTKTQDIEATITAVDETSITLHSGVAAEANTRYEVVVRRVGSKVTLEVDGAVKATETLGAPLTNLETWSLAGQATRTEEARYPFQGVIHNFLVVGAGS
jgi:hypothetical protein